MPGFESEAVTSVDDLGLVFGILFFPARWLDLVTRIYTRPIYAQSVTFLACLD